jgi:tetratricopeptide (TPR) repeat protein
VLEEVGHKPSPQLSSFNSFPIVLSSSLHLRHLLGLLAAVVLLGLSGCGESERFSYATETDEPNYREGQSLLKAGRRQEALTAFLKVIDKRRDDAPESHLEVGLLYVQHINDPLSAIYHFRKYLALRPNSPQAPLVRQRIDAAIREFARTLPAQPLEGQGSRVDLVATLDKLKQENESLKQQLADSRAGRNGAQYPDGVEPPAPVASPTPASSNALNFSVETVPTVRTRPAPATPPPTTATVRTTAPAATARPVTPPAQLQVKNTTTVRPQVSAPSRPAPAAAPTTGARRHTIQPGDTLSKIALKYYGNRAKWRDIYAANRDVMKSESDLKAGMQLKIP